MQQQPAPTRTARFPFRLKPVWRYALGALVLLWAILWGLLAFVAPALVRDAAAGWAHGIGRTLTVAEVSIRPWSMTLQLDGIELKDKDGSRMFAARRIELEAMPRALLIGHWHAQLLSLDQPQWLLERNPAGSWNWARLVADATAGPKSSGPVPKVLLDLLTIHRGRVAIHDRLGGADRRYDWRDVALSLRDISTLPSEGGYQLSASLGDHTRLHWRGLIGLEPLVSSGRIRLTGLDLPGVWGYLAPYVRLAPPQGRVSFDLNYVFDLKGVDPHLTLSSLFARIDGLQATAPGGQSRFALNQLALEDGIFDLQKQSLFFKRIRLNGGSLGLVRSAAGTVDWQAALPPAPARPVDAGAGKRAGWKMQVNDLRLENWKLAYRDDSFARPLQVDTAVPLLSLALRQDPRQGLSVERLAANLQNLAVGETGRAPLFTAGQAQLSGASLGGGHLQTGSVTLEKPALRLTRAADGRIDLVTLLTPRHAAPASAGGKSLQWTLPRFGMSDGRLDWNDSAAARPVALALTGISGTLSPSADGRMALEMAAQAGRGALDLKASLDRSAALDGSLEARSLPLVALAPYVLGHAPLTMTGGDTSARLQVRYRAGRWQIAGQAGAADMAIREAGTRAPLVAWHALALNGLTVSGNPLKLSIRDVRLDRPQLRLVLDPNRVPNLRRLFVGAPADAGAGKQPAAAPAPQFDIARIHVRNGDVDFADQGMKPVFATRIHQLSGSVTGLSSRPGKRGAVAMNGAVDAAGDVRVNGALAPLAITDSADISLLFRNIPLTSLNTYSENLAGWQIRDGSLSVDLHYQLNQRKLNGDNRIVIESIQLGQEIQRPGVSSLPLRFAVAVLEDSDGRIDLHLPVSGNLDDPKFSYGGLVWQAFVNVIKKVATAPFRALGSLLGIEGFDDVRFVAGEAAAAVPERQKLGQLAQMMASRPQMKLVLSGSYDPVADRYHLARARVDAAILHAAGDVPDAGAPLPAIDPTDPEIQPAIKTMFAQRVGRLTLMARQVAGIGKDGFYAALRREAIEREKVGDADLLALANARARNALAVLRQSHPEIAERITLGAPKQAHASADGIALGIDLSTR